jgi:glutathione S-transferase
MVLYHCLSARSFRPLWMLEEVGAPYELQVLPFPPRAKSRRFLDINPLGTVPALVDGDLLMSESAAICQFLAARFSPRAMDVAVDGHPLTILKLPRSRGATRQGRDPHHDVA